MTNNKDLVLPRQQPKTENGALYEQRPDLVRRVKVYRSIGVSLVWLICTIVRDESKHATIKGHVGSILVNLFELDVGIRPKLKL